MTGCTAARFGNHDFSQPPHSTPDNPVDADDFAEGRACMAQSADMPPWCQHESTYELVIYQIATHEWIRMLACIPCTATLRRRHERLGPRGTQGIARIRLHERDRISA